MKLLKQRDFFNKKSLNRQELVSEWLVCLSNTCEVKVRLFWTSSQREAARKTLSDKIVGKNKQVFPRVKGFLYRHLLFSLFWILLAWYSIFSYLLQASPWDTCRSRVPNRLFSFQQELKILWAFYRCLKPFFSCKLYSKLWINSSFAVHKYHFLWSLQDLWIFYLSFSMWFPVLLSRQIYLCFS